MLNCGSSSIKFALFNAGVHPLRARRAIQELQGVATTMGFSALDGLMMGTVHL